MVEKNSLPTSYPPDIFNVNLETNIKKEEIFDHNLNKFVEATSKPKTQILFSPKDHERQLMDYESELSSLNKQKEKSLKWLIRYSFLELCFGISAFNESSCFIGFTYIVLCLVSFFAIIQTICNYTESDMAIKNISLPIICQYENKTKGNKLLGVEVLNGYVRLYLTTQDDKPLDPVIVDGFKVIKKTDIEYDIVDLAKGIIYKKTYPVFKRNAKDYLFVDDEPIQKKSVNSLPKGTLTIEECQAIMAQNHGHLRLNGRTDITGLPIYLNVPEDLDITGTSITQLPDGLKIKGDLYMQHTPITEIPSDW